MLLKHLSLDLNNDEYSEEETTRFGFQTRYLTHFVERRMRRLRFHADGFNQLLIEGRRYPLDGCPIVPDKTALSTVVFDAARYQTANEESRHSLFLQILADGIEKAARSFTIPLHELKTAMEGFVEGGYVNKWTTKRKLGSGLYAWLDCLLDQSRFLLTLRVELRGSIIVEDDVLETLPDDLLFHGEFADVRIDEGSYVVVVDSSGDPIYSRRLDVPSETFARRKSPRGGSKQSSDASILVPVPDEDRSTGAVEIERHADGRAFERLSAQRVGAHYAVTGTPLYARGIARQDVVEAEPDRDGGIPVPIVTNRTQRSKYGVVRVRCDSEEVAWQVIGLLEERGLEPGFTVERPGFAEDIDWPKTGHVRFPTKAGDIEIAAWRVAADLPPKSRRGHIREAVKDLDGVLGYDDSCAEGTDI